MALASDSVPRRCRPVCRAKAVFDRDVLACDIARFLEALPKPPHEVCGSISRSGAEKPHHWHRRLLRASGQRPRGCRAAEQRDELALVIDPSTFKDLRCQSALKAHIGIITVFPAVSNAASPP